MRAIINYREQIDFVATIEIDPEALQAYWKNEIGVIIDGHVPDWAVKQYLQDQYEVWQEQVDADPEGGRIINANRALGEINVIS